MSDDDPKLTSYFVQMRKTVAGAKDWSDVDVLDVPMGTKRATLLKKVQGLDLGLEAGEKATVRIIPWEFAREEHVEMVQPAPVLKVNP